MRLYDTMTRQKEEFVPASDYVTMYVCGITPYDTTHLGHAFTYVVFDTLARYFQFKGWPVRYAQNVTDIDDDILRKAKQLDERLEGIGRPLDAPLHPGHGLAQCAAPHLLSRLL